MMRPLTAACCVIGSLPGAGCTLAVPERQFGPCWSHAAGWQIEQAADQIVAGTSNPAMRRSSDAMSSQSWCKLGLLTTTPALAGLDLRRERVMQRWIGAAVIAIGVAAGVGSTHPVLAKEATKA